MCLGRSSVRSDRSHGGNAGQGYFNFTNGKNPGFNMNLKPEVLSIMPKITEISVENQMERLGLTGKFPGKRTSFEEGPF